MESFDHLSDAVRIAHERCKKEIQNSGELFYDIYLAYDNDYLDQFHVFHELSDEGLENWIQNTYYDYVIETNKIGSELEQLKIWQYIHEENVIKYPLLYRKARKALKINGEWIYRNPRTCTPEAVINFSLD